MPDHLDDPPPGLSPDAERLWVDHLAMLAEDDLVPTPSEYRLLLDAVRSASLADELAAALTESGAYTVPGGRGAPRPNPLLLEIDRARRTTGTLLRQLATGDRTTAAKTAAAARWRR